MSELIDPRPVFTIVMGCNGVGKSTWKRKNYDLLPDRYYDQDSIAGGLGEWSDERARTRTREIVDAEIAECLREELNFGIESTSSSLPGPEMVRRVVGMERRSPERHRHGRQPRAAAGLESGTGHPVDPRRIPTRWKHSLSNLRRAAERFDLLRVFDNSEPDDFGLPRPVEQCRLERGTVVWRAEQPLPWCVNWLEALADRQAEDRRRSISTARGTGLALRGSDWVGSADAAGGQTQEQHSRADPRGDDG